MGNRRRVVENLKTVIIVVLFAATILLLYLLWSGKSSGSIDFAELLPFRGSRQSAVDCSDVLMASRVIWGEGDGSFQSSSDEIKTAEAYFIEQLRTLYQGTVLSYSISEQQFRQAVRQSKSSVLCWNLDISFSEFCQYNEINGSGGEGIAYISSMAISRAAQDSIIIYDGVNDLYYRLAAEEAKVEPYSGDQAEAEEESSAERGIYYPADAIFGSSSGALLPITEYSNQADCRYEKLSAEDARSLGVSMAEAVFGNTFDFVRRITDDFGTITYMYGYGQKTLTVNSDGSFEYKEETSGESAGFYSDLQTALDFVSSCGGWGTEGKEELGYRLSEVKQSGTGRAMTYRFSFSAFIKNCQVYSEKKCPIIVEVSLGQVSYYYRNTFALCEYSEGEELPVSDAANVIASNANHMYKVLNGTALSPDTDEAFAYVANSIVSMEKGYYMYETDGSIVPCWTVCMEGGTRFFFDLYEGVPLGFAG